MKRLQDLLPEKLRLPVLTAVYGIVGGLGAVAFMLAVNKAFGLV